MHIVIAKFYALNPNYLLISGEKALIIRIKGESDEVIIADRNRN